MEHIDESEATLAQLTGEHHDQWEKTGYRELLNESIWLEKENPKKTTTRMLRKGNCE